MIHQPSLFDYAARSRRQSSRIPCQLPRLTVLSDRTITLRTVRAERIIGVLTGSRGRFGWRDRNGVERGAFERVGDVLGDIGRRIA